MSRSHLHPVGVLRPVRPPGARPGARRSGGSPRSSGSAACTRTPPLAGDGRSTSRSSAPDGRAPPSRRRRRRLRARHCPASCPTDRVSARVWDAARDGVHRRRPGRDRRSPSRSCVTVTGHRRRRGRRAATLLVKVGAHAKATVVVRFAGLGDAAPTTSRSSSATAPSSPSSRSRTGTTTPSTLDPARQGRPRRLAQARRRHLRRRRGAPRHHRDYAGPGGSVEMLGLYFADAGQHIEHRLFVDHNAPKTKSNVLYKGALQGEGAHTVWIGNVLIRKVAEGIETYEENRNLVLTDGCQADSVPNLEIETGEIEGAGHASATGRFDDEQLFYLRSRGHLRGGGAPPGRARLLQRPDPQDRRARARGAADRDGRGRARQERASKDARLMSLRTRLRRSPTSPTTRPSASRSARYDVAIARARRRVLRDPGPVLATPPSRSPRARSRTAPSSAGCTARASTCAPASPPACPPPSRSRPSPSRSTTDDVYVDITTTLNGVTPLHEHSRDQGPARLGRRPTTAPRRSSRASR